MISDQQRRDMREHARRLVADWPPLTPEVRTRLSALLRPGTARIPITPIERKEAA